jgi:hypothetical protein
MFDNQELSRSRWANSPRPNSRKRTRRNPEGLPNRDLLILNLLQTRFAKAVSAEDRTAGCRFAEFGCQLCLNRRFHGALFLLSPRDVSRDREKPLGGEGFSLSRKLRFH